MIKVRKSPNMISTTGRSPVMAAPTPMPVKPGSEIGVSITRSLPNSSTRPDRTLKGVPASATSSPMMQTRESRRISSASASRMASPNVSSRTVVWVAVSGIDVLLRLVDSGIGRGDGEFHSGIHLRFDLGLNFFKLRRIRQLLPDEPIAENIDGITLGGPALFFLLGPIVFAIDVAHVMAAIAVGVAQHKCRTCAGPRPFDKPRSQGVHGADVLPIHAFRRQAESRRSCQDVAGSR